jgi:hypothetical protein
MPTIHDALDPQGHACVSLLLHPSGPRGRALQLAGQKPPSPALVSGMLDSGAAITVIDPHIRQALNLAPFRVRILMVPSHPVAIVVFSYKIDLIIVHPSGKHSDCLVVPLLTVLETPLSHTGTDVLVGCDVLKRCIYLHHGQAGTFTLIY